MSAYLSLPFLVIVLGLSRFINNKPFLLSFGENYVFLVYCGSLELIFYPSYREVTAVGLASSHNSFLPWGVCEWGLPVMIYYYSFLPLALLFPSMSLSKLPNFADWWSPGGGHLGIFWVGMCRPGLQIGTPF